MRDLKSKRYVKWRDAVFKKNNYTCQKCEAKRNLEAHHIFSWVDNEYYRFNIEAGITLCQVCHKRFHKRYGSGGNTKKQIEEFLGVYLGEFTKPLFG